MKTSTFAAGVGLAFQLVVVSQALATTSVLPSSLPGAAATEEPAVKRPWTIADIVEVARITSVSTTASGKAVAFTVSNPSVARGSDRYGLYVFGDRPGPARKLIEASYLDDVQARPGTASWTVRADLGKGIQLYEVDGTGRVKPLVVNPSLAPIGGFNGFIVSPNEGMRWAGIVGYQWAPDGTALWYSKFRTRTPHALREIEEAGIVYDESATYPTDFAGPVVDPEMELHVLEPARGRDRVVGTMAGNRVNLIWASFVHDCGATRWLDSHRIAYRSNSYTPGGVRTISRFVVDTATGRSQLVSGKYTGDSYVLTLRDGSLDVARDGGGRRLVRHDAEGSVTQTEDGVAYGGLACGLWEERDGGAVMGVRYRDREGLAALAPARLPAALASNGDNLDTCSFDAARDGGYCVRETISRAPELVAVSLRTGTIETVARPNARFDAIETLRTERAEWTNRFGARNDGYVTYPRDYQAGRLYPAIVVTHGGDAQNKFLYHGFQWEYPVQAWAERGYFVLSVNEPRSDEAALLAYQTHAGAPPVAKMQFEFALNPVAGMEAAAQALVDQGLVDPQRIGIAGYSRGSEIVQLSLSQSKLFRAGSNADDTWYNPSGAWAGAIWGRGIYKSLFGGAITDPANFENYRALSPALRAAYFAGPLLQQFTWRGAPFAQEMHFALRDAGVPTELVYYRDETHLLHHPRRRASAMQLNLDWFDYWLLERRDPDPAKAAQYARWDAMRASWATRDAASPAR